MSLTIPLRNVKRHRWRTILIILGIAISVGLETGIAISIDSLYKDYIDAHRGENFTDITIHPKSDTTLEEMRELLEIVKDVKGVKKVSPVATFTLLEEIPSLSDLPNNIILYGLETTSHPDWPNLEVFEGNKTLAPRQVIISGAISRYLNLPAGIRYSIPPIPQYSFRGTTVLVTATIGDQLYFGNYIGFLFIFIDIDFLTTLFHNQSYLNFHLTIQANNFININTIAERLEDTVGFNYYVFREKSLSDTDLLAIQSYQAAMNLLIIASFVVEFLFITNILAINVKERSKEFGILRAVGSSTRQIIFLLAAEIIIYGCIGSIIGNILGIGVSLLLILFLNINFPQKMTIDMLVLNPASLFSTFMTGIFIALISGLYPIFIAVSLPVVQNIHWQMRAKKQRKRNWLFLIIGGSLLTVIGISTSYFIGPTRFLAFDVVSWHFFAVWAVFLGTLLVESGILHFLPKIGMIALRWHKIVPRTIATRNVRREFAKSIATIMVASLALTFVLLVGIISSAIIESVPAYYDDRFGRIDVIAEAKDDANLSPSFIEELVNDNIYIEKAAYMQQQRTSISNVEGYIFGIDPDSYRYFFEETMLLPADPNIPSLLNASEKGVIVSHFLLNRIGARIGDDLSVQVSSNSTMQVIITGITFGNPFLQHGNYIYCSNILYQDYWQNDSASWFIMTASRNTPSLKTLADQLKNKYPDLNEVIAVEFYSRVIEHSLIVQTAFFQMLFLHSFILSGLAQFVCILITTLKMEREIGIMRSMGLSKWEVFSTFFAESTLLGTTGVIVGLINGIVASELMAWYISQSIPIKPTINPQSLIFWVTVSFCITIGSTVIPSYRSSHKNIAFAINNYVPRQIQVNPYQWGPRWEQIVDDYLLRRSEIVSPHLSQKQSEKQQ